MRKLLGNFFTAASKPQVDVMYFGRTSEFLMMTSECVEISEQMSTLEKMLDALRLRGGVWAYELDGQHVVCTINRKAARGADSLSAGDEVGIFSSRSSFA